MIYRRSLARHPHQPQLLRGLEYARSQVAYTSAEERAQLTPQRDRYAGLKQLVRNYGLFLVAAFLLGGCLAATRWLMTRNSRWLRRWCRRPRLDARGGWRQILRTMAPRIGAKNGIRNCSSARRLAKGDGWSFVPRREAILPAGVEAIVHERRSSWVQIELADGTLGWVPGNDVWAEFPASDD